MLAGDVSPRLEFRIYQLIGLSTTRFGAICVRGSCPFKSSLKTTTLYCPMERPYAAQGRNLSLAIGVRATTTRPPRVDSVRWYQLHACAF